MRQMKLHHPVVGLPGSVNLNDAVASDNAAVVKRALLTLWDEYKVTPHVSSAPSHSNMLWDRVRVQRLRFQGTKQQYLVVLAADGTRRLLVLHRPPRHMDFEETRTHALRQMTYRDNVDGTFEAGRRVKWEVFNEYGVDDAEILRARHGHPLLLLRHPARFHGRNYPTCVEQADRHHADLSRLRDCGFHEGPLLFTPHLVTPMGGIWKPEKNKYRVVMDATGSQLNGASVPLTCVYDLLEDVLKLTTPSIWQSGLDLKDYFYMWAYTQADADYWGLCDPVTGEYDRLRFCGFGGAQSPYVAQRWSRHIQRIINEHGLKYCTTARTRSPEGFSCTGVLLDDFHLQHLASLTQEEANEQFESVCKLLHEDLGIELNMQKKQPPAHCKEYLGFLIDSKEQTVTFTQSRRDKLCKRIDEFLEEHQQQQSTGVTIVDICGGVATGLLAALRAGLVVDRYYLVENDPSVRAMASAHMERLLLRYPSQLSRVTVDNALTELPGDLEEITPGMWRSLGKVDHLNAAWPCQGLSRASQLAKGLRDRRTGLFWNVYAALCELREVNADLTYILENVAFQDRPERRFKRDFLTVCNLLGQPLTFCASLLSAAKRRRNYWTNVTNDIPPVMDGVTWQSVLKPHHVACEDKAPTVMRSPDTYSVRSGRALVFNNVTGVSELPDIDELERMVGLDKDATAAHGVCESARRAACGNILDGNVFTYLMRCLPPKAAPTHGSRGVANRRALASLVGSLQFCAVLVHGGQLHLREAYKARDCFAEDTAGQTSKQKWRKHVQVNVTDGLVSDFTFWRTALADVSRPIFLSSLKSTSGFWLGKVVDEDAVIDHTSVTADNVPVATYDASGTAGGAWFRNLRWFWPFPAEECAPHQSSNFRELATGVKTAAVIAPILAGEGHKRALLRSDNSTAVAVINKKNTRSDNLEPLLAELLEIEKKYDVLFAARHIAGVLNGLGDGLSRWVPRHDSGDWRLRLDEFSRISDLAGGFDVDAAADPVGLNAHCDVFYSHVDPACAHDWAGKRIYANPDFGLIEEYITHAKKCYTMDPFNSSVTLVLPVWTDRPWWRKLKGFQVLAHYAAGSELFTSPPSGVDCGAAPAARVNRGPSRWGVIIVHLPSARRSLGHRGVGGQGHGAGDPRQREPSGVLPALCGHSTQDVRLLCQVPAHHVSALQRIHF